MFIGLQFAFILLYNSFSPSFFQDVSGSTMGFNCCGNRMGEVAFLFSAVEPVFVTFLWKCVERCVDDPRCTYYTYSDHISKRCSLLQESSQVRTNNSPLAVCRRSSELIPQWCMLCLAQTIRLCLKQVLVATWLTDICQSCSPTLFTALPCATQDTRTDSADLDSVANVASYDDCHWLCIGNAQCKFLEWNASTKACLLKLGISLLYPHWIICSSAFYMRPSSFQFRSNWN